MPKQLYKINKKDAETKVGFEKVKNLFIGTCLVRFKSENEVETVFFLQEKGILREDLIVPAITSVGVNKTKTYRIL
jgi:hypothetical protein